MLYCLSLWQKAAPPHFLGHSTLGHCGSEHPPPSPSTSPPRLVQVRQSESKAYEDMIWEGVGASQSSPGMNSESRNGANEETDLICMIVYKLFCNYVICLSLFSLFSQFSLFSLFSLSTPFFAPAESLSSPSRALALVRRRDLRL